MICVEAPFGIRKRVLKKIEDGLEKKGISFESELEDGVIYIRILGIHKLYEVKIAGEIRLKVPAGISVYRE